MISCCIDACSMAVRPSHRGFRILIQWCVCVCDKESKTERKQMVFNTLQPSGKISSICHALNTVVNQVKVSCRYSTWCTHTHTLAGYRSDKSIWECFRLRGCRDERGQFLVAGCTEIPQRQLNYWPVSSRICFGFLFGKMVGSRLLGQMARACTHTHSYTKSCTTHTPGRAG